MVSFCAVRRCLDWLRGRDSQELIPMMVVSYFIRDSCPSCSIVLRVEHPE